MNKLRETRERAGLTLSELDRLSGVSERTIRYIENEEKPSKKVTRQKIINGFNNNPRNKKIIKYEDVFDA